MMNVYFKVLQLKKIMTFTKYLINVLTLISITSNIQNIIFFFAILRECSNTIYVQTNYVAFNLSIR